MISCVIIDDEKLARDSLDLMISRYLDEKLTVLAKSSSLKEGVFAIYDYKPHSVFMDTATRRKEDFIRTLTNK